MTEPADRSGPADRGNLVGPWASTGYWLKLGALAWQRELDSALRPLGLTSPQFSVLAAVGWLNRTGPPPTQQQVADFAGADRMMTSKLLTALEAQGLVRRVSDEDDARIRRVLVTDAGRERVTESAVRARQVDHDLFGADTTLRDSLHAHFGA